MIVTTMVLNGFKVQLGVHWINKTPKLVMINWLAPCEPWQHAKSIKRLQWYYHLTGSDIQPISQADLNPDKECEALLLTTICQLNEYADKRRAKFCLPIDISIGSAFEKRVWRALQTIPIGETISYAQLARKINQPTAYRAVANANGKNPLSIVIPCHRVISSNDTLGGYTGGTDKKRWLLSTEGVERFKKSDNHN